MSQGSLLYSSGERVEDNSMLFVLRGEASISFGNVWHILATEQSRPWPNGWQSSMPLQILCAHTYSIVTIDLLLNTRARLLNEFLTHLFELSHALEAVPSLASCNWRSWALKSDGLGQAGLRFTCFDISPWLERSWNCDSFDISWWGGYVGLHHFMGLECPEPNVQHSAWTRWNPRQFEVFDGEVMIRSTQACDCLLLQHLCRFFVWVIIESYWFQMESLKIFLYIWGLSW